MIRPVKKGAIVFVFVLPGYEAYGGLIAGKDMALFMCFVLYVFLDDSRRQLRWQRGGEGGTDGQRDG